MIRYTMTWPRFRLLANNKTRYFYYDLLDKIDDVKYLADWFSELHVKDVAYYYH